jgi:choline kinase
LCFPEKKQHRNRQSKTYSDSELENVKDGLTSQCRTFSFEDITGMPWIEIDFAADVERATSEVLPRILAAEGRGETGRSVEQGP